MSGQAWNYRVNIDERGAQLIISGTLCGVGWESVREIKQMIARQHRAKEEDVIIRKVGTEQWR